MTRGKRRAGTAKVDLRRAPRLHRRGGQETMSGWASRLWRAKFAVTLAVLVVAAAVVKLAPVLMGAQSEQPAIDRALPGPKAGLTSAVVGNAEGQRLPEFALTDINGRPIAYDSGKPRIIFFMASWCLPCVAEERALARVHGKYGDRVGIVTIDVDLRNDTVADLRTFQQRYGGDWPHALDVELAILLKVRSLDTTYVVNRNNVITYLDMWATDFETLESEVLKVLPAEPS